MLALAMGVFVMFVVMVGTTFAGCEDDCNGPFQTCLNLCRQTTKEDSAEGGKCVDHCFHGLAGCQNRCKKSDQKSENMTGTRNVLTALNQPKGVSIEPVLCAEANAVNP